MMITITKIRREMHDTYLNKLPNELLLDIIDIVDFNNHARLQYKLNKELCEYFKERYFNDKYWYEYVYDAEDDTLLMEVNFL